MKTIWNYLIVASAGLFALSCSKVEDEKVPSEEVYTYVIAIDEGTRSYLDGDHMAWETGDGIGWFVSNGSYPDCGYSSINMTTPRTFSITSIYTIYNGSRIYACAPCSGIKKSGEATLFIPFTQSDEYGLLKDAMPMVSLPIEVTGQITHDTNTPIGQASFANLGAVIKYNVFTSDAAYGAEEIQSVTFEATTPIAGDFDVDLTTVTETSIPTPSGLTEKSVTSILDTPEVAGSSKADGLKVFQVVAPGTISGTVTVTTDAAVYSYDVASVTLNRAKIKTINVDLASANATRRTLADFETLLTAHEWLLVSVVDYTGTDITQNAGDALTFNADQSLTITCNTQPGEVYDYNTNGWVDYRLGYSSWDATPREWSITRFEGAYPVLGFTDYAYPLAIVSDFNYPQEYSIVSLTDTDLVLKYFDTTITFSAPAAPAPTTPEDLLKAHQWELASVSRMYPAHDTDYWDDTKTAGNKITFNADYSFTFDCSANSDKVYDYYNGGYATDFYFPGGEQWSLSETGGKNYLNFTKYAYPLVIVDDILNSQSFEITVLTDTCLKLFHNDGSCNYIITFTTPGEKSSVEGKLTAHNWTLSTVTRDGVDVTQTAGNIMKLNANHSINYDCSSNNDWNDHVYDYIYDSYDTPSNYSWATWEWSVSFGAVTSLVFSDHCFPLVIVGDFQSYALPYEIVTLTDTALALKYNNGTFGDDSVHGLYVITFTATP